MLTGTLTPIAAARKRRQRGTAMTERATQTSSRPDAGIEVLRAPRELDMATADGLAAQGCAIAAHAWVLLLDLTALAFCDARGLCAFVQSANQADRAGCRLALIAPSRRWRRCCASAG